MTLPNGLSDDFSKAPTYFRCDCYSAHHFVMIEPDPYVAGAFDVTVCGDRQWRFWDRVKWAWKHVFCGEHLVVADVILSADSARQLANLLAPTPGDAVLKELAEMREEAAKVADELVAEPVFGHERYVSGMNAAAVEIATAIRSIT